jgi:hypothetical protein
VAVREVDHLRDELARAGHRVIVGAGLLGLAVVLGAVLFGEGGAGVVVRIAARRQIRRHRLGVATDGSREGFDARQEPLLEVHDGQPPALALDGCRLGVGPQQLGQGQVRRRRVAEGEGLVPDDGAVAGGQVAGRPGALVRRQGDLHHVAIRVVVRELERLDVALEAPDHDLVEERAILDRDAASEALRIEDLEESRERIGVAVVGRGRQEEAVLEAWGHVADHWSGVRIDRVAGGGRRRGVVGLVDNEEAAARLLAEVGEEEVALLRPAEGLVRDDEARVGRPGVDAEAALLAAASDEGAVVDLEAQAEALLHLALPLQGRPRPGRR